MSLQKLLYASVLCALTAHAQIPQPPTLPPSGTVQIKQFGAKGDGKTDDTKAFVSAIAANQRIQLDSRTYLLSSALRISGKPIAIEGSGNSVLLFSSSQPIENAIAIYGSPGAELKSLAIRGTGNSLVHAVSVGSSRNVVLDNLRISSIHGTGKTHPSAIVLNSDDGVWVSNGTMTDIGLDSDRPSFAIWNYYHSQSQHIYIDHNQISGNTANISIGLFDTNHSIVANNTIDGGDNCLKDCTNSGYGILFYRSYHGPHPEQAQVQKLTDETITGNHVSNTAGNGIYLQGVADSKIIGNVLMNTTQRFNDNTLAGSAIALSYADNIQVLNNTIQNDAKGGICLAYTKGIVIDGNQIHGASKWDIRMRVSQTNTTIRNNSVDGPPRITH